MAALSGLARRGAPGLSLFEKLGRINWLVVLLLGLIGAVGYAVLFSAAHGSSEPWAWRHAVRLGLGLPVMLVLALVDIRRWLNWAYPCYAVALLSLVAVEAVGSLSKGAQRWIDLGIVQLQPSELMKIALILALARFFHGRFLEDIRNPLSLVMPALLILLPAGLVMLQPDLGTAVMLLAVGGAMFFVAGVPWWLFAIILAAGGAALPVAWGYMHDYQRDRVLTFLTPERDPLGTGYHIIQSKIALGSGGLWGQGFLHGTQAQLAFLPERQTDFAFTMFAEENGFVGAMCLLALYMALFLAGVLIATRSRSQFGRLLAMGVTINFALYVFINISMVTGLIPVVGVPLPLVSYGGTAMLTALLGFGLALGVGVHEDTVIPRHPGDMPIDG